MSSSNSNPEITLAYSVRFERTMPLPNDKVDGPEGREFCLQTLQDCARTWRSGTTEETWAYIEVYGQYQDGHLLSQDQHSDGNVLRILCARKNRVRSWSVIPGSLPSPGAGNHGKPGITIFWEHVLLEITRPDGVTPETPITPREVPRMLELAWGTLQNPTSDAMVYGARLSTSPAREMFVDIGPPITIYKEFALAEDPDNSGPQP